MNQKVLEEIQCGNFSTFNHLNEDSQIEMMKKWDKNMWIKYCMQNTVTEEEVFDPIIKLIEEDE